MADLVEDLLETFIAQRLSQNRSGGEIARLLRREVGQCARHCQRREAADRGAPPVATDEQAGLPGDTDGAAAAENDRARRCAISLRSHCRCPLLAPLNHC